MNRHRYCYDSPMTASWVPFALGAAFFAGLTAVFAKVGVEKMPSNLATLIRTTVIVAMLSLIVYSRHEWQNPLRLSAHGLTFLILSGLATGLSWMCYYRALQLGPVSVVNSVDKLSFAIAILLSIAFLGEKLNLFQWLGAGLIFAGTLLIILKQ
jgi:transporter family protein